MPFKWTNENYSSQQHSLYETSFFLINSINVKISQTSCKIVNWSLVKFECIQYKTHVLEESCSPSHKTNRRKMESNVELGFIEKCEPWLLTNKFFPSKLGGRPAWLDIEKIPQRSEVQCAECDNELTFLCQVSDAHGFCCRFKID